MGQYHKVCNVTRREYLHPHRFDDGLKLMEFGSSADGTLLGLAVLLAASNGRGNGDLDVPADCPPDLAALVGSWAGDRIVIAGDYGDEEDFAPWAQDPDWGVQIERLRPAALKSGLVLDAGRPVYRQVNLYDLCGLGFLRDVSAPVIELLLHCGESVRFAVDLVGRQTDTTRAIEEEV